MIGIIPVILEIAHESTLQRPGETGLLDAVAAPAVESEHHLADDVRLELVGCVIADAHRRGALVAGEAGDLPLLQVALAGEPVHDLHVGRVSGHRPQQPVAPVIDRVVVAVREEHRDGEGGVAEPDVAVVPVALAAECLGEGGRRCGDDSAGPGMRERPEDQKGAHDFVAVRSVVVAALRPGDPPPPRLLQRRLDIERLGRLPVRREPRHAEIDGLSRGDGELAGVRMVRGAEGRAAHHDGVRSCDSDQGRGMFGVILANPGDRGGIAEPDAQILPHPHVAPDTADAAHEVGAPVGHRHGVRHLDLALGGGPAGHKDHGVALVAARRGSRRVGRREQPAAVVLGAQQGAEGRLRVVPREAQPVDAAVLADEGPGIAVTDQGVVLDRQRHVLQYGRYCE